MTKSNANKETLTLAGIRRDLRLVAKNQLSNTEDWCLPPMVAMALLAVILGKALHLAVGLVVGLGALYFLIRYVIALRAYRAQRRELDQLLERGDISISLETLSHVADEVIYEPSTSFDRRRSLKEITVYYFLSGAGWREARVGYHYAWSREFSLSGEGLRNISLPGNEFYYVTLQGHSEISYIYPCKLFRPGVELACGK